MAASPGVLVWEALLSVLTVGVGLLRGWLGAPRLPRVVLTERPIAPKSFTELRKKQQVRQNGKAATRSNHPYLPSRDP